MRYVATFEQPRGVRRTPEYPSRGRIPRGFAGVRTIFRACGAGVRTHPQPRRIRDPGPPIFGLCIYLIWRNFPAPPARQDQLSKLGSSVSGLGTFWAPATASQTPSRCPDGMWHSKISLLSVSGPCFGLHMCIQAQSKSVCVFTFLSAA